MASTVNLAPSRTVSNDWNVSGAASAHDALAQSVTDNSDQSFIYQKITGKTCRIGFSGMIENTKSNQLRLNVAMRAGYTAPGNPYITVETFVNGSSLGAPVSLSVANSGLKETLTVLHSVSNLSKADVDSVEVEIKGYMDASTSDQRIYAVSLEVTYESGDWNEDVDQAASWTENT